MSPCESEFHSSHLSQSCLLAYQPTPLVLHFSFEGQIEAVEGYWYGENASAAIDVGERKFLGTPHYTKSAWPDTVPIDSPPELFAMSPCERTFHSSRVSPTCLLAYRSSSLDTALMKGIDLGFYFEGQIEAVEGYWYGENASVTIDGGARKFQGTPNQRTKTWSDSIEVSQWHKDVSDPEPLFGVVLQLDSKDVHRTLQLSSDMDVVYPQLQATGFSNTSQHLTKNYTVFVITPEEMEVKTAGSFTARYDPRPSFDVSVQLDPEDVHQTLQISAAMDVVYPQFKETGFTNSGQQLAKKCTVFVVVPAEMAFSRDYNRWKHKGAVSVGRLIIGVFGALVILLLGFVSTGPTRPARRQQ